jgi:leucyl aminopeptidase
MTMKIELETNGPESVAADLLAVPYTGAAGALLGRLDALAQGRLSALAADARSDAGSAAVLPLAASDGLAAARVALVGAGAHTEQDEDSVRTAAAAMVHAARGLGGTVAWAFDDDLPLAAESQVRAVVEGALLGGYDPGRWKTGARPARPERLVIAGAPGGLGEVAARSEVVARWTNRARELVDGPPNEVTPAALGESAERLLTPLGVAVEVLGPAEIEALGMGGLATVGRGSANEPRLVVLRHGSGTPALGLVGKAVTFDTGGYFIKGQGDIVKMKADMGGGAAVLAAVGAIAELELPQAVLGVLPAAENAIDGAAYRPGDILTTAAGLTVEVTNTDAEGRLLLADGLWFARRERAARLVDIATLTGAMRGALGDMYVGVFANDDAWRDELVAAGNEAGEHAWPWPLHRRYRGLLDSQLADLKNTAGRSFGYPIVAAAFLERFVDERPWAHLDIHSTAFLDEERGYLGRGASGAGVRLLVELARRLS